MPGRRLISRIMPTAGRCLAGAAVIVCGATVIGLMCGSYEIMSISLSAESATGNVGADRCLVLASEWPLGTVSRRFYTTSDNANRIIDWWQSNNPRASYVDTLNIARVLCGVEKCTVRRIGWPLPNLICRQTGTSATAMAVAIEDELTIRVMPVALASNIMIVAALMALACLTARTLRERWRRSRHLCPKCGYDLKNGPNLGCPECAWNRDEDAR